jgi:hypothetical protein
MVHRKTGSREQVGRRLLSLICHFGIFSGKHVISAYEKLRF